MRNQYKRLDVFRCRLQSHDSFAGRVSAFHVLKVKRCLPEGCIWFDWRCRLLEKGGACHKGYHFPGKNCNGCRYYYEEKVHKVPEVLLDRDSYRNFQAELEEFEDWLRENLGRRLEVFARVSQVGPQLTKRIQPDGRGSLRLEGYLASLADCFLGRTRLEDTVYLRLSRRRQQELGLARQDKLDFEATLEVDQGRLVLVHPGRFEFRDRPGGAHPPDHAAGLVDTRTASVIEDQNERCLRCERGRLVDVVEPGAECGRGFRRELFCLEGVRDPALCCYGAFQELRRLREGSTGEET